MDKHLDERQHLVRGKAFKHSFFTVFGLLMSEYLLWALFDIRFFESVHSNYAIAIVGITVFTLETLYRDAFPLQGKKAFLFFGFISLTGFLSFVLSIIELTEEKKFTSKTALSETAAMLVEGIMFISLGILSFVIHIKNKNKKEEE